ncbi:MAG TPA: hypothetical protein VEK07_10535 [Polyangiaceae bacterium]|nr:hypothetical protein [Polyangiaceae bacterium]
MIPRALAAIAVCLSVAGAALGVACSSSSSALAPGEGTAIYNSPPSDASDAGEETTLSAADAANAPPNPIQGSPLCNSSPASAVCYPDDPATPKSCGSAPDGGTYDPSADYDGAVLACHIVSEGGVPPVQAPACLASGSGADGATCDASADCVATQECVGAGTCRPYCCSAPCDSQDFCDIQLETQNPALVVPVCMPVRPCGLLNLPTDAAACPDSDTCTAFVGSSGVGLTTCVAVGSAREGDSCDSQHCATGLVCLGMWGEKRCYALCHTEAGTECSSAQTCTGGLPLFPNPAVGLCQQVGADF